MEQSYLIELIKTLSEAEKAQVLEFISNFMLSENTNKINIHRLLIYCISKDWNKSEITLDKKEVYNQIFQNQVFVEGKLEKLMVEAHKILKEFLLKQYYFREENEFHQIFDYAEIIRKRGLENRYKSYVQKLKKIQSKCPTQHNLYFHNQYLLEYAIHNHESYYNLVKGDLNIPQTLDALDMHLFLNRLALLNVYLLQSKAANVQLTKPMEERLEETKVPERYLNHSPNIRINHTIFEILKNNLQVPEDAKKLFQLLKYYEHQLDNESLISFYTYLRNICNLIVARNEESEEINNILFDLYKDNLERGLLHYEGKLHPSRYLAISRYAGKVGKHEWALQFIEKYQNDIIGETATKDIYRLNLAICYFESRQFEKALDNIPSAIQFVDYQVVAKRLELKVLYELHTFLYSYKLDSFKMFISRTSQKLLSPQERLNNLNFLNLLSQLSASIPGDKKRAEILLKRIQEKKQAAEWRWLLAKAEALKNRHA